MTQLAERPQTALDDLNERLAKRRLGPPAAPQAPATANGAPQKPKEAAAVPPQGTALDDLNVRLAERRGAVLAERPAVAVAQPPAVPQATPLPTFSLEERPGRRAIAPVPLEYWSSEEVIENDLPWEWIGKQKPPLRVPTPEQQAKEKAYWEQVEKDRGETPARRAEIAYNWMLAGLYGGGKMADIQQIEEWRDKGKIGWGEEWRKAATEAFEKLPFVGPAITASHLLDIRKAMERLQKEPDQHPSERARDQALVADYLNTLVEEQVRGRSLAGKVAGGIAELPGFVGEFVATGGLGALGEAGAKKVGVKLLKAQAQKGLGRWATKAGTRVGAAVAGAAMRTPGMATRVWRAQEERRMPFGHFEGREFVVDVAGEKPFTAFMKSFADVWIENASEVSGVGISRAGRGLLRRFPGARKITKKIGNVLSRITGGRRALWAQTMNKVGYHGLLEEIGEERIGDVLRAVTGVENFGTGDSSNVFTRVWASIPDGEELAVELGVFAPMTAMGIGGQLAEARRLGPMAKAQAIRDEMQEAQRRAAEIAPVIAEPEGLEPEVEPVEAPPVEPVPVEPEPVEVEPAAPAAPAPPVEPAVEAKQPWEIRNEVRGAHHGQVDGTLYVGPSRTKAKAFLDYSIFEGTAYIEMVEVAPELRRQGLATALVDELRADNPGVEIAIAGDFATSEGVAFARAVGLAPAPEAPAAEPAALEEQVRQAVRKSPRRQGKELKPGNLVLDRRLKAWQIESVSPSEGLVTARELDETGKPTGEEQRLDTAEYQTSGVGTGRAELVEPTFTVLSPETVELAVKALGAMAEPEALAEEGLASQLQTDESGAITVDLKGIDRIRDTLGRLLSDEYARPPEWLAANRKANAARRAAKEKAGQLARDYRKVIRAARLTKAEAAETHMLVEDALRAKIPMDKLSPPMREWAERARSLLDEESRIAAAKFREVEMETLAEVYEGNIGKYLKNIPKSAVSIVAKSKAFVGRLLGPRLTKAFGKVKRDAYILKVNNKVAGKFDTEEEAKVAYYQAIEGKKDELINKWGRTEGMRPEHLYRAAARRVELIEPIPEEWRVENEIHYPPFLVARSIVETRHNGEIVGLFSWAAEKWGQQAPPRMGAGELATWAKENKLAKLPESAGLHDLKGLYVPEAIAEDLTELIRAPDTAMRIYRTYMTAWKSSKTVWNPATHGRNIMGNPFFAYLGGVSVWNPLNVPHYVSAIGELTKWHFGTAATADIQALIDADVIGNEFFGAELRQLDTYVRQGNELTRLDQALASLKGLHNTLGRIYAAEDQVFKLAAYKIYRSRGMTEAEAVREVDTWFPNYARTGKLTRWLRNTPIAGAPFVSFLDQSLRIALRAAKRHPIRLATIIAMPGILSYISTLLLGIDDDEKELIDKGRGYFEPLLPFRDAKGRVQTLDLRYIMPLANDLAPEMRRGGVRIPWIFSGPLFAFVTEQTTGKESFTGRMFVPQAKDATEREKAIARARQAFKTLAPLPSFLTYGLGVGQERAGRIQRAAEEDSEESLARAVIGTFTGVNIRSPYIAEDHAKTVIGNMLEENDKSQAAAVLKMWNEVYKPGFLPELSLKGIAQGQRQSADYYWRRYRDQAAEFVLQGKTTEAERSIRNYQERHPRGKALSMRAVEARAREYRAKGKTR